MEFQNTRNNEEIIKASRQKWKKTVQAEEGTESGKQRPKREEKGETSRTKRSPRRTESRLEQKGEGLQEGGLGLVGYLLQGVGQISNRYGEN